VAGGAFAATKLVSFLRDSVKEARESQKVNAQTAAVLKSTGNAAHITADQIGTLATSISNKTGIDDEAIQSSENMLLTFTNVRNEVGKGNDIFNQATQTVTDMSVALGTDAKSSAIQLGKALNDPIKGITALTRVGVTFTAEQKKQIETMVKSGNILGAQKVILGELSKEFGGSAAAQATAGEKMATTWANFKEAIGTKLLPVLDKLESWFTEKVVPVLVNQVIPAIINTAKWVTGTLVPALRDQLGPVVSQVASWVKGTLVPALQSFGRWVADNQTTVAAMAVAIGSFFTAFKAYTVVKDATLAIKGLTLAMAANPILLAAAAILALGAAFVVAYKKSREFRDNVQDVFSNVKIAAAEAAGFILRNFVSYLVEGFRQILHGLVKAFGWVPIIGPKLKEAERAVDGWARGVQRTITSLKADIHTEQVNMKVRDMQRRIDSIRQNKVLGLRAGTGSANYQIALLQYRIDHLRGKAIEITTTFTEVHNIFTVQNAASNRGPAGVTGRLRTGGIWRAAAGGIRSGYGLVGEDGPELVKLPRGSMVYPAGQSRQMMARAAGSGGVVKLEINSGGSKLDDLLVELLRKAVRTRGGNVQLVLGR
jgi:hypothetical protein